MLARVTIDLATKGYVIPPGQPGKRDRNIENEKTNFFVGVPKLCGLNTDANPHIQNQKHCDSKSQLVKGWGVGRLN